MPHRCTPSPREFHGADHESTPNQYSLAVTYCELLTGTLPFNGKNYRQLALQHTGMQPDLSQLPEHDRPVVARALAKDPGERFRSCLDFIQALEEAAPVPAPARTPSRLVRSLKSTLTDLKTTRGAVTPGANERTQWWNSPRKRPPSPPAETLAEYRFLECLSRLPIGEVWKAEHQDGRRCLVKLVFGCQAADEMGGSGAVARLASLRHPALEPFLVIRDGPNRVALISDEHDSAYLTASTSAGQRASPACRARNC